MKIQYLDSDDRVKGYLGILSEEKIDTLSLDIEGEFNLHQYGEKLCLIQIFDGQRNVVIDPFSVSDELISRVFDDGEIQKIMYDASSDQKLILKQYGVRITSILDLRPAAELLDLPKQDLSSVLEMYLGVRKTKNYQRYNWTKRPVEPGALDYAMNDVIYLFELRDRMFEELNERRLMESYRRKNYAVNTRDIKLNRKPGFFRKPSFFKLKSGDKDRVQKIFYIREKYAEQYNVPPNHILSNRDLIPVGTGRLNIDRVRLYDRMKDSDREHLLGEVAAVLNQG